MSLITDDFFEHYNANAHQRSGQVFVTNFSITKDKNDSMHHDLSDDDDDDDDGMRVVSSNGYDATMAMDTGHDHDAAASVAGDGADGPAGSTTAAADEESRFILEDQGFEEQDMDINIVVASNNRLFMAVDENALLVYALNDKTGNWQNVLEHEFHAAPVASSSNAGARQNAGTMTHQTIRIQQLFVDPVSGNQVLVCLSNGDVYFLNLALGRNRVVKLQTKLKDLKIESIAWNRTQKFDKPELPTWALIGTADSCLFEVRFEKSECVHLRLLLDLKAKSSTLPDAGPITGISIEQFPKGIDRALVLVTTHSRCFRFVGHYAPAGAAAGGSFADLFDRYLRDDAQLQFTELPIAVRSPGEAVSELRCKVRSFFRPADSFAWLNQAGIFHGRLDFNQRQSEDILRESEIVQFSAAEDSAGHGYGHDEDDEDADLAASLQNARGLAITEYHMMLMYPDRVQVIMLPTGLTGGALQSSDDGMMHHLMDDDDALAGLLPSRFHQASLDDMTTVFEFPAPIAPDGSRAYFLAFSKDEGKDEIYVHTKHNVYKIIIDNESRDVWKLYLDKARNTTTAREEYFDLCLRILDDATPSAAVEQSKDQVLIAKANFLMDKNRYAEAANVFSRTTKSFEEVALLFMSKDQDDAVRKYAQNRLKYLAAEATAEQPYKTQISVLTTWLVELYLEKLNELLSREGDKARVAFGKTQTEFREFLEKHHHYLDHATTFQLISSYGHVAEVIYFAMLTCNYERVIQYCITEKDYKQALAILNRFCTKDHVDLFYRFTPILVQHLPKATVNMLTNKQFLDPARLIPALIRYITVHKPQTYEENVVIRYLEWCISDKRKPQPNTDPAIHNLLLSLYSKLEDPELLLRFLNIEGGDRPNYYDPKYALRVCREAGQTEACVRLYSSMNLHEDAVEVALEQNDIRLARECADKPTSDHELKKKLWLKITTHVIQLTNATNGIDFLSFSDQIRLDDILPLFEDFQELGVYKKEIIKTLEDYKQKIATLKREMAELTDSATLIREDIEHVKQNYCIVQPGAKCSMLDCCRQIDAQADMFVFPCQHQFHQECLASKARSRVPKTVAQRIDELMAKRKKFIDSGIFAQLSEQVAAGGPAAADIDSKLQRLMQEMEELDDLIGAECPMCGNWIIESVDEPFLSGEDKHSLRDWFISGSSASQQSLGSLKVSALSGSRDFDE